MKEDDDDEVKDDEVVVVVEDDEDDAYHYDVLKNVDVSLLLQGLIIFSALALHAFIKRKTASATRITKAKTAFRTLYSYSSRRHYIYT